MLSTDSGFSESVYLTAAQERMTAANLLLLAEPPQYVLATYTGGVAIECLFHAYRMHHGKADTAHHDLNEQSRLGKFFDGMSQKQREAMTALIGEIYVRWQNNHRYRSEEVMRAFLVSRRLFVRQGQHTMAGEIVRRNAEIVVNAATELVTVGVERAKLWQP